MRPQWIGLTVMSIVLPASVLLCNVTTGAASELSKILRDALTGWNAYLYKDVIDNLVLWGLLSGAALLAAMWLGAGIMALAMRLRHLGYAFTAGFGTIITVACLVLAEVVGPAISMSLATFIEPPEHWQPMPPLPEQAVEIAAAAPQEIRVRTTSGQVYSSKLGYNTPPSPWVQAQGTIASNGLARSVSIGSSKGLPNEPVSTAGVGFNPCAECGSQVDYAVLPDGTVWWSLRNFNNPLFGIVGLFLVVPRLVIALGALFTPALLGAALVWGGRVVEDNRRPRALS